MLLIKGSAGHYRCTDLNLGDGATGYSECGEGSGPACLRSSRAALEGGSRDNCLPEGNQGSGGCVPAGSGLETFVVRL